MVRSYSLWNCKCRTYPPHYWRLNAIQSIWSLHTRHGRYKFV